MNTFPKDLNFVASIKRIDTRSV